MKPKTELLLYRLLWRAEQVLHPSLNQLTEGFECWAARNGELNRIHELERLGFLERHPVSNSRASCLGFTKAAMKSPARKHHPPAAWNQKWNREWHQILFDLDAGESKTRKALHRALRRQGFGCLQGSVWIHPFLQKELGIDLVPTPGRPENFLRMKSRSLGKHTDRWMVEDAWNWDEIDKRCDQYMATFRAPPTKSTVRECLGWVRREYRSWQRILEIDPLLPDALLPAGYPVKDVWEHRQAMLSVMAHRLETKPRICRAFK